MLIILFFFSRWIIHGTGFFLSCKPRNLNLKEKIQFFHFMVSTNKYFELLDHFTVIKAVSLNQKVIEIPRKSLRARKIDNNY